ncbi:MAG: c-type cytochrome [Epsilonproteobacteria bacterium]|nr:c-type cytochrome [Campylobacterota bacterium]
MKRLILFLALALFAHEGEKLYSKYGCYGCHGIDAKGGNGFPPLANKPKGYLIDRLQKYRLGTITSNRSDMMKPYAKNLSDKEIETIADYLANLKSSDSKYYEEYDLSDAM